MSEDECLKREGKSACQSGNHQRPLTDRFLLSQRRLANQLSSAICWIERVRAGSLHGMIRHVLQLDIVFHV